MTSDDQLAAQLVATVRDLTDARARLAAVQAALATHPAPCPESASCGWKEAVTDARTALGMADTDTTKEN